MPRQPTPFLVAKLKGFSGKRAKRPPPEPAVLPTCPEAPSYLPEYARQEWDRVAPGLWAIGLLSILDVTPLAAYCASYALWRRASEELDSLTVDTRMGDLKRHPLIKVIADAASDMVRFSSEFGLTPVARTRIANGIHRQPPPSKFSGLLARPQE